ncbi:T9SS type B sorting domain-containing protein [Lutibacter sp.]|uniref:Ig-like domain-containing protein n=1 Tax=Lutibacter sp. TaxID=1925666 RepID=UPI003565F036
MHSNKAILLIFSIVLLIFPKLTRAQTSLTLTSTGNQNYCPLSTINIVEDFNISNPTAASIDNIYIQISQGYVSGEDILSYTGTNPNISAQNFSTLEGKLVLTWVGSGTPVDTELITAVKNVVFSSTSSTPSGTRTFSITVGEANYLASTGHYYEYVSSTGITWQDAKTAAAGSDYYGLQGYLATITSAEEAQLSGKQAAGAGWIGGSDAAVEGTWRWVTGPETGKSFWIGNGSGTTVGTDIPFANWNTGNSEPNNLGNEDYAHVTAPGVGTSGSWNDLSNTGNTSGDYQPKGYIVEYGGMPGDPVLNISTSTTISIAEITATTPSSNCGTGNVTLSATASTGTVIWFSAPTGGTKLWVGNTFTTTISTTTTYYAVASADGICDTGKRNAVIATIYTIPTITSVTNTTICNAGTGTLTATASAGTINWYDALTGGNLVGTGTSYSPTISATTTYYVNATENGCTTATRTPVTINVQYTTTPTGNATQTFCDIENAKISNLTVMGTAVNWYANATGGTALNSTTLLTNNTNYYATQTVNGCESTNRLAVNVIIYQTVVPLSTAPILQECDTNNDGDDMNGFTIFDLTSMETTLLNGASASNFSFSYFTDAAYSNLITTPTSFTNTIANGQPIYVRISNVFDTTCSTETLFSIQVNQLPSIVSPITFKNCDEDGTPNGVTDYNLNEANSILTNGDTSLTVSYYLTLADANSGSATPINPAPFNNSTASTVYARVENSFGCYRVATINLQVSTTSFSAGFMEELENCDDDATIDGLHSFDLTLASANIIAEFPLGQNLSVKYYRNLTDAQLEQNEILPQNTYVSETPFSQILYVRVESNDNGDCFGIGPHLTLTVHPRPEFEVEPEAIVCLNLPPITLDTFNANDTYTYEWTDESNTIISNQPTATVSTGGVYTVVATSGLNCTSFEQTVTVSESNVATITLNDITITDDSNNNTITINTQNLGIGDYEFSLDDSFGNYQDDAVFENVAPGIHTIYIQDKNSCGISQIEVSVIGFPKFFTPNNDGYNDTWQIKGVSDTFYATSIIYIFDRYGKLITKIDPSGNGWDGYFNGKMLPATDYWFSVQLIDDAGNIRERKGHFSLIR